MQKPRLSAQRRGAHSELLACAWLIDRGYEVFRNVAPDGWVDLVALRWDEFLYLDVKTSNGKHFGALTPGQIDAGVKAIYVLPNGDCVLEKNPRRSNGMGNSSRNRKIPILGNVIELPKAGSGL